MKKILICILMIMSIINLCKAQNPTPSGYIAIGFGYGFPLSDYSSMSCAEPGSMFNITFGLPIAHSNFGIAARGSFGINNMNITSYLNNYIANTDYLFNDNASYTASTPDNYSHVSLLAGAYATIPVKRFSFDFRLMGGFMYASIPEIDITIDDNQGNTYDVTASSTTNTAFAWDCGFGIRYSFTNHFDMMLDWDYLSSNQNYTRTVTEIENNNSYSSVINTYTRDFALFTSGLSFAYQF